MSWGSAAQPAFLNWFEIQLSFSIWRGHTYLFIAVLFQDFKENEIEDGGGYIHRNGDRIDRTGPRIGVSQELLSTSPILIGVVREYSV